MMLNKAENYKQGNSLLWPSKIKTDSKLQNLKKKNFIRYVM